MPQADYGKFMVATEILNGLFNFSFFYLNIRPTGFIPENVVISGLQYIHKQVHDCESG